MKNPYFQSINGVFGMYHSDIRGVIRQTIKEPILAPTLVETPQIPTGTMMPTDKEKEIKVMKLLTTAGQVGLGPEHAAEMEVFLSVYPLADKEQIFTCDKKQLPKPTAKILAMPN